jgi:hypothetical protein
MPDGIGMGVYGLRRRYKEDQKDAQNSDRLCDCGFPWLKL